MNRITLFLKLYKIVGQIQKGEDPMKWLPSLLSVISLVATAVAPVVQHAISVHPIVAMIYTAALGLAAHFSPSPVS